MDDESACERAPSQEQNPLVDVLFSEEQGRNFNLMQTQPGDCVQGGISRQCLSGGVSDEVSNAAESENPRIHDSHQPTMLECVKLSTISEDDATMGKGSEDHVVMQDPVAPSGLKDLGETEQNVEADNASKDMTNEDWLDDDIDVADPSDVQPSAAAAASLLPEPARRRLGRLKRLDEAPAATNDDTLQDQEVGGQQQQGQEMQQAQEQLQEQEPKKAIKKRVTVKSTGLDDDLLLEDEDAGAAPSDTAADDGQHEDQEENADEEDDAYWDEEDEYAQQILLGDKESPLKVSKKHRKRGSKLRQEEGSEDGQTEQAGQESDDDNQDSRGGSQDFAMEGPDEQRRLRDAATGDRIGKGFVAEVKPLDDLLAKLQRRSKAVVERAEAAAPIAPVREAPPPTAPAIDFGSLLQRLQAKQQQAVAGNLKAHAPETAAGAAPSAAAVAPTVEGADSATCVAAEVSPGALVAKVEAAKVMDVTAGVMVMDDDEDDELEIVEDGKTPGKQQAPALGADDVDLEHPDVDPNLLVTHAKVQHAEACLPASAPRAVDEGGLHRKFLVQRPPGRASRFLAMQKEVAHAAAARASSMTQQESLKLELTQPSQLEAPEPLEDAAATGNDGAAASSQQAGGSEDAVEDGSDMEEDDGEEVGEEGDEELAAVDEASGGGEDESDDGDGEEEEDEEASSSSEEAERDEDMAEAEPLAYEEDELEEAAAGSSQPAAAAATTGAPLPGNKRKEGETEAGGRPTSGAAVASGAPAAKRRNKGASRFVDMEAELSDEDGQGGDVSEDEHEPDVDEDGMLAELINEVKEGRRDHTARTAVHKRWEEEQDLKDVRAILHGIKNGFRKNRAGQHEGEDGTDMEARRRRAALFADQGDDDLQVAVLPGELELVEEDDEQEQEYSKMRHEARKRQLAAGGSPEQDGSSVLQSIALDSTASEVMALMSRAGSQSLAAPAHAAAAANAVAAAGGAAQRLGGPTSRFTIFGKDLTNVAAGTEQGSSFLGRTATTSMHRAASANAASKSFVFGADNSNSMQQHGGEHSRDGAPQAAGNGLKPSSFAGLKSLLGGAKKESKPSLLSILKKPQDSRR